MATGAMRRLTKLIKTPLVIGVVIVGLLGTGVVAASVRRATERDAERWLSERADVVRERVQSTVLDLIAGIEAVAAFIEVTEEVSQEDFAAFVSRLDERLGLIGIAYVGVVDRAELGAYEAQMRERIPGFAIQEVSLAAEPRPSLGIRDSYYPVELFAPGRLLAAAMTDEISPLGIGIGVDGGSNPEWRDSIAEAFAEDRAVVSEFIDLRSGDMLIGNAFIIAVPVRSGDAGDPYRGLVAAPMIDRLLPTQLDDALTDDVAWELTPPGAASNLPEAHLVWEGDIEFPGSTWHIRVQPTEQGAASVVGTNGWQVVAIGVAATVLIAAIAELLRQRARSRLEVDELQRLSDEKDRFLAAVSHEIRTPLTAVSGLARELRDRPSEFSTEEHHSLLAMVSEQSDEVAAIVEDLLVAARSDMGKVTVSHTAVDVLEQVRLALEGAGIVSPIVGRPQTLAFADPQRVRQILRNLLTNAVRYGGDELEVRFETRADEVSVMVVDSGSPIPDEQLAQIFDAYTSAHGDKAAVGSIGLGLFISRTLAELMDGTLTYHHDGSWSIFTLCLPSAEAAHAAKVAAAGIVR